VLISEYEKMAMVEDSYWWHTGRKSIISRQLKRLRLPKSAEILNIGAGTGGMVPLFRQYGNVTNVDVSEEAVRYCERKGMGPVIKVEGIELPFPDNTFDVVAATDVLEHIENDVAALKEWNRVLKPGGTLLLTVPAYQWLWSGHDESLHHFRRYTATQVGDRMKAASLDVTRRTYVIVFSFPMIVAFRAMQKIRGKQQTTSYVFLPSPVNRLFKGFLQIEARALRVINFPFGTSVLALARKSR
jgi:ubiquinone/menaquinone biosynthesis C-methylase UbiE